MIFVDECTNQHQCIHYLNLFGCFLQCSKNILLDEGQRFITKPNMNDSWVVAFKKEYSQECENKNYHKSLQILNDFLDVTSPGTVLHTQIMKRITNLTRLLARQYIDQNDYGKAYPYLKDWYQYLGETSAAVNYHLGRYHFSRCNGSKALYHFKKAKELKPHVQAYQSYWFVCSQENKFLDKKL